MDLYDLTIIDAVSKVLGTLRREAAKVPLPLRPTLVSTLAREIPRLIADLKPSTASPSESKE